MKKQRKMLKKIIKEELFYRDFYRASDLLVFNEDKFANDFYTEEKQVEQESPEKD